jgi:hypothetical protein
MNAADRAIRVSATVAVLGVAVIAAYISYWHAYEVIRAHGETGVTARLEPATIDGLVYCSSVVILYAARHQLRAPALACWLLGLGIVATLAANLAHGWSHGPIGATVAAWPAASLIGSYELMLWLIRTASANAQDRVPAPDHMGRHTARPVPDLQLVPNINGLPADVRRAENVRPNRPGNWTGPVISADQTDSPKRSGTDDPNQDPARRTVRLSSADASPATPDTEAEINAAAVAA